MKNKCLDCPHKLLPLNTYCGLCDIINKTSMKCKKCGSDNPIEGTTPTLKQQIDRITEEAEDKIQQIVLDHYQQTGVMMSIRLEYVEMTDKISGGKKTLMPIIRLCSTL